MPQLKMKRRKLRGRLPRTSKAATVRAIREELDACGDSFVKNDAPETNVLIECPQNTNVPPPHLTGSYPQIQMVKSQRAQAASAAKVEQSSFRVSTSGHAAPTDTPTPVTTGSSSSSKCKVAGPGQELAQSAMSINQPSANACPNVGLLKAQSPWLRKDGVCIAVFEDNSSLTFVGRVQLRVLAGVLHSSGYVLKPSSKWHELFIPVSLKQPALSLSPLSPALIDPEFSAYLEPFRSSKGIHFHASSSLRDGVSCSDSEGCVVVDLEGKDLSQMNQLAKGRWRNMVALVLLKPLSSPFSSLLTSYLPSATHVNSQWIDGFQTVHLSSSMEIPNFYKTIGWDLAQLSGVSLLVCGAVDVGKSTLCRYLVNYLLNRWPIVAYVDLDVGQTEFTVPGLVSLHLLTEPVLGPPMTHLRRPTKAYYFGASSPADNPDHYYRAVRGLQRHIAKVIRPTHPDIPVIINTCGWVKDMGFSLLLDIIRTFDPSHIVQLLHPVPDPRFTFTQLTPNLLQFFSGIYTRPESSWGSALTMDYATAQEVNDSRNVRAAAATVGGEKTEREGEEREGGKDGEIMDEDQYLIDIDSNGQERFSGSEEEGEVRRQQMMESSTCSSSEDEGETDRDDLPLLIVGCHTTHHHLGGCDFRSLDTWTPLLSHQLFRTLGRGVATFRTSSPLLEGAESVAREHGVSCDPCHNMLFLAPPLEIPWSDVAIHVVNSQVPRSQMLFALNGRIVALGQVHLKEMVSCEINSPGVGVVKFLKSNDPLIEFIGLGLVRAIDAVQQRYYVTTPLSLSPELLDRVNVLAIGHTDSLPHTMYNTAATLKSPYC